MPAEWSQHRTAAIARRCDCTTAYHIVAKLVALLLLVL
jgi:hypothetical protein